MASVVSVQRGTTVLAADTQSTTATISAVVMAQSLVHFTWTVNSSASDEGAIMAELTATTTITFERADTGASPAVTLEWVVVEFDDSVAVQRGTFVGTTTVGTADTVTLSAVTLAQSWPMLSYQRSSTPALNRSTNTMAEITTTTELTVVGHGGTNEISWQVIDYGASAVVALVSGTLVGTDLSDAVTISSVDLAKTILVATPSTVANNTYDDRDYPYLALTAATTLTIERNDGTGDMQYRAYVVEIDDGITTQRGLVTLTTETTDGITISSVDPDMAMGIAGGWFYTGGVGTALGAGFYANLFFTLDVTAATTLTITRAGTAGVELAWQVVDWTQGGDATPSAADSLTISDSATLSAALAVADSLAVAEAADETASLSAADSLAVTEASDEAASLTASDSLSISESAVVTVSLDAVDSLAVTEAADEAASLTAVDDLAVSEAADEAASLSAADSLAITENAQVDEITPKSGSDSLSISESAVLTVSYARSDSLTLSEATSLTAALSAADSLAISDSAALDAGAVIDLADVEFYRPVEDPTYYRPPQDPTYYRPGIN